MKPVGHTILRLEETPSTNTLLLENPQHLENHGLVAVARHQTAGRGRVGRHWVSLLGRQLQFSVVLHPPLPREQLPALSLVIGLAVARALREALGLEPRLKWPNDVFVNGRKVCGVLLEVKQGRGGAPRVVAGIGLNCLGSPEEYPPEVRPLVTTLAHEAGRAVDLEAMLQQVLAELQTALERVAAGELPALLREWEAFGNVAGQAVRYPSAEGQKEGTVRGLAEGGELLIETAAGELHLHSSGELEWLA